MDHIKHLANGFDLSLVKAIDKQTKRLESKNIFQAIALEWHAKQSLVWVDATSANIKRCLEADIFPWLGNRLIKDISAPELLSVLRKIESRGAHEKAQRARANVGRVFSRYAIQTGRAERDPSGDLRGALTPVKAKHHASITDPQGVAELMRAIARFNGSFVTQCALQLAPLVFVRPGELRQAEWSEINFDKCEWRIPSHNNQRCRIYGYK